MGNLIREGENPVGEIDERLAGSRVPRDTGCVATMDRLIRTMVQKADIPLADAARMVSETPARIMGVYDRKGSLQKGKDADIIVMDEDLKIRAVWAMGKLVPETDTLS